MEVVAGCHLSQMSREHGIRTEWTGWNCRWRFRGTRPNKFPDYYYQIPERPIYKSYPVYEPNREPAGYWAELQQKEPEVLWGRDENGVMHRPPLATRADWIEAGKLVFFAASTDEESSGSLVDVRLLRNPAYYEDARVPLAPSGVFPFASYVVKKKGKVVVGQISCGTCHTRILSVSM